MSETPRESPDAFAAVLALVALITDAPACKARLLDLQRQADQLRDLQAKHAGEVAATVRRNAELDARREQLDALERKLRRREAELNAREQQAKEAAALRADRIHDRTSDGFFGGLTRELPNG